MQRLEKVFTTSGCLQITILNGHASTGCMHFLSLLWQAINLHRNPTTNKGRSAANNTSERNFPISMFHQKNRCFYMQTLKVIALSIHTKILHVWSNTPTRLTSSLARLLTRCACFVLAKCTCYHKPVGSYNVVIEHGVGTHRFCSNLCSGFDLVSLSLGRTSVLGLELGTRLRFMDWITDEIVSLSLPSMRLWLFFWPLPCAAAFTLHLALSFDTNLATSFCSMLLPSCASSAGGAINFQFQNSSGFIMFQTEGRSQCLLKISAGFFLPAMWWMLIVPAATAYRTLW